MPSLSIQRAAIRGATHVCAAQPDAGQAQRLGPLPLPQAQRVQDACRGGFRPPAARVPVSLARPSWPCQLWAASALHQPSRRAISAPRSTTPSKRSISNTPSSCTTTKWCAGSSRRQSLVSGCSLCALERSAYTVLELVVWTRPPGPEHHAGDRAPPAEGFPGVPAEIRLGPHHSDRIVRTDSPAAVPIRCTLRALFWDRLRARLWSPLVSLILLVAVS